MQHVEKGFEKLAKIFKGFNSSNEMLEIWIDKFARVSEQKFNFAIEKIIDGNEKLPYNVINEMWRHIKAQDKEEVSSSLSYEEFKKFLLSQFKNGMHMQEWTMTNGRQTYRWVRNVTGLERLRIEEVEGVDIPIYAR